MNLFDAMLCVPPVQSTVRKRPAASSQASGASQANAGSAGMLRFYNDDAPGLKIGPTTVLISSLMFIGSVVVLHIWGKISS